MWLPNALIASVEHAKVRVFYVSYAACRTWAEHRDKGEPLVFSGWYWSHGPDEAGPFKSRSAAFRDAWYVIVRRVSAPGVALRNTAFEREKQIEANRKTQRRRKVVREPAQPALL